MALWLEKRVPPLASLGVAGMLNAFLDGLAFAQNPRTLAWVVFWSIIQWTLSGVTVMFALLAVGIIGTSSYELLMMTLLVLVATNLSMAIPSAPGYVGVFHGVFVATLALFSVGKESATAAAVVEHALVFGLFIIGGAYFMARGDAVKTSGRRLSDLVSRAKADHDEPVVDHADGRHAHGDGVAIADHGGAGAIRHEGAGVADRGDEGVARYDGAAVADRGDDVASHDSKKR
jgi:hypothetical protein